MNSYSTRSIILGLILWVGGTIAVRLAGHYILRTGRPSGTVALYLASFVLMGVVVRRILHRLRVDRAMWPAAATLLMLPTLILDPFSCLFFGTMFPNLESGVAGLFGGWMLMFCAGAVAGAWV